METHKRPSLSGAIALLAVALTGCGEPPPESASVVSGPGRTVIRMRDDMSFDPERVTVSPGDTVVWVNEGSLPHTTTFAPSGSRATAAWDSGLLQEGEVFRTVLSIPGSYAYLCTLHELMGMAGVVEVEP